jgi:phosphatidylserine decarboxylase
MLTKYGLNNIIFLLTTALMCLIVGIIIDQMWLTYILFVLSLIVTCFVFIFFRDPERHLPEEAIISKSVVLSPADGRVIDISNVIEDLFLKSSARQISIFLSPLDVHVNRIPISGVVRYFKYHKGKFLAAFKHDSSVQNEQTHIGIENSEGKIFFKQIVGILARRLVWDINEGDIVKVGQRFGMMKFGSRMDVIIPISSDVYVKIGDKVKAGETIIARIR